jgi:hypothetical protein
VSASNGPAEWGPRGSGAGSPWRARCCRGAGPEPSPSPLSPLLLSSPSPSPSPLSLSTSLSIFLSKGRVRVARDISAHAERRGGGGARGPPVGASATSRVTGRARGRGPIPARPDPTLLVGFGRRLHARAEWSRLTARPAATGAGAAREELRPLPARRWAGSAGDGRAIGRQSQVQVSAVLKS